MMPKFFYFDLGKVLVDFSIERMLTQIGAVAGVAVDTLRTVAFERGLMREYETGRYTTAEFYEVFCAAIGSRPPLDELARATAEIFTLHLPTVPLVAQLRQAGCPLGILSNTCAIHWEYCRKQYRVVAEGFAVHALSYELRTMKPAAAMYQGAAELAGCRPEDIFFVDDLEDNVRGARDAGFDAVLFTSARQLAADLRARGVRFNY